MTPPLTTHRPAEDPAPSWAHRVLDELDQGIIVLAGGDCVHANRVALALLDQPGCPLRRRGSRLVAATPQDNVQLDTALRGVRRGHRQMIELRDGAWSLALALIPLFADVAPIKEDGAVLAVLGKQRACGPLAAHWFGRLHRLTPAESNVLAELLSGLAPRSIAERNGVALSTVRTQIASILDKTASRNVHKLLLSAATLPSVVPIVLPPALAMAA